jgi:glycosyltransferase involved in cell wall biosynthesis
MIEAGAAGCKLVTTNIGGLAETGSEFATLVPIQASREELVMSYASALNREIDECKTFKGDEKQSEFYNTNYSWEKRKPEWERLFDALAMS